MRTISLFAVLFLMGLLTDGYAQVKTNTEALQKISRQQKRLFEEQRKKVLKYTQINKLPLWFEIDSVVFEMQYIDKNGNPQYLITNNSNAAKTISSNEVYSGGAAGLNLDGTGVVVRQWDAGSVLTTHQEFGSRVANLNSKANHYHSTHVAGTIMAAGIDPAAKGMAFAAGLRAFDWDYVESEMAEEALFGALVSNHSYGYVRGWSGTTWYGDTTISKSEDYKFGFYDNHARLWDEVAYYAPFYLIVKSAGNDRNDAGDGSYPPDGPYDCLPQMGTAKNILTVGAVGDIVGGYTQPSDVAMSSFSSWGPTDDGRVKPDIVANGVGLFSTDKDAVDDYRVLSGTSMAAPSATGSLALLIQHYKNLNDTGSQMWASTLKALVIHTADEAGTNDGPDYEFGWGLMNTLHAAEKISEDDTTDVMLEHVLMEGESYTRNIVATDTSPIKVTLVWTDFPGTPPSPQLDPPDPILVSDLDLSVSDSSVVFYPWKLDRDNPWAAATRTTENNVDNVEVLAIDNPAAGTTYTITVDHDGTLHNGSQAFSLIISGDISNALAPVADFFATKTNPGVFEAVELRDASANIPTSWNWQISPPTFNYLNGTDSSSQNPQVEFLSTGNYTIFLSDTNTFGYDTITKNSFILVSALPEYCYASGGGDEYISGVQLGNIYNIGTASDGYADYTSLVASAERNQTLQLVISCGVAYPTDDIGVWVDWNHDGDFDDTGEEVVCGVDNGAQGTYPIVVPAAASLGFTRMRVRVKENLSDCGSPCLITSYGEVEDYTIKVVDQTIWTGIVSADWTDASNWTGSVPDENHNAIIPASPDGGLFPVIDLNIQATCNQIHIAAGASVTISGLLDVKIK